MYNSSGGVQAKAGMLEFWWSLLRQSNPSTLTAAGLGPNFILAHPPLRDAEEGDDKPEGDEIDGKGVYFSSPNRASWTNGFAARTGGDPQKYGGDAAAWFP